MQEEKYTIPEMVDELRDGTPAWHDVVAQADTLIQKGKKNLYETLNDRSSTCF